MILYAETSGRLNTTVQEWAPIPGLALKLPEAVGTLAALILNVPNPLATGTANPGGQFGLKVGDAMLAPIACFTYCEPAPQSFGRVPTTLTVTVPLNSHGTMTVQAMWLSVRNSDVIIDTPATLTAIIA